MRAVNLLPKDAQRTKGSRRPSAPVLIAAATPVVAACAVFGGYSLVHSPLKSKERKLAAVQAQVAALPKPLVATPQPVSSGLATEQNARRSALDSVLIDRVAMDRTLVDLARVLPGDVWLTALTLVSPTPADATTSSGSANGFSLNGYTYTEDDVAQLLTRLEVLPMLQDVTLGSTAASKIGNSGVVQFTVTGTLAGAPDGAPDGAST